MSDIRHPTSAILVGLISDTHGLVRPEVHTALAGVELILHAGDVGGDEILDELSIIAPVQGVFGNTDEPGNPRLPAAIDIELGGLKVHVSHGHELGVPKPAKLPAISSDSPVSVVMYMREVSMRLSVLSSASQPFSAVE